MPIPPPPAYPPATAPARLGFLDGLRGLAALGVVVHHYTAIFYPTTLTGDPATAHLPGHWEAWLAASPILLNFRICLFFVLSGLVLAESVARAPRGWRPLLAQLARRYVRLAIPVAASVTLAYGLLLTHHLYNQPLAAATGSVWARELWRWLPTFRQFVGDALYGVLLRGELLYNIVLWTMSVEWRGSLLVLGALALAGGRPWRLALYAGLAFGSLLNAKGFYYVAFLLGLTLHDVYQRQWLAHWGPTGRRLVVSGLLVGAAGLASYPQTQYQASVVGAAYAWLPAGEPVSTADFYHTLGAAALLAAVLLSGRLQKLVAAPLWRRIGKRAFSLYLLHFLLLGSGSAWLFGWLRGFCSYHVSFGLMILLSGTALVGLTEVFYRLVDLPSHGLARWVGRGVGALLAAGPPRRRAPSQAGSSK